MAAALSEARPPSLGGAFSIIDKLPGGWFLLLAIALGLCAYAGWRLTQALLDLRGCGWHAKGLVRRAGMLVEVVLFAGFGLLAAVIALDRSTRIRQEVEEEMTLAVIWTACVLDWPLGHWIIAGVGVGAIAMGFNQLAKARRTAFEDISASEHAMMVIRLVGRIGFAAKGMIFGATGVLFLIAAWRVEASAAGDMRAALTALALRIGAGPASLASGPSSSSSSAGPQGVRQTALTPQRQPLPMGSAQLVPNVSRLDTRVPPGGDPLPELLGRPEMASLPCFASASMQDDVVSSWHHLWLIMPHYGK